MTAAWAADCPELTPMLTNAENAVFEGRYEAVASELRSLESAFSCQTVPPEDLARFWLYEGAALVGAGDTAGARESLLAARRVSPDTFLDDLGSKVRTLWEQAKPEDARGHVSLSPVPRDHVTQVDGVRLPMPATIPTGMHLVQVVDDDEVVFGQVIRITDGALLRIDTGLVEAPIEVPAPMPVVAPPPKDPPELLVLGASALALSAGSLGMWAVSDGQIKGAEDVQGARRAQDRKMAFGAATVTLGAVGALGIAGELVF